jgi:hypothetical protein
MGWIRLNQGGDRQWSLVYTVVNLHVPWNARNFMAGWVTVTFPRRTVLRGDSLVNDVRAESFRQSINVHQGTEIISVVQVL